MTQQKKLKSGAGLTLIELMTVLGMIALVAAITAPSFASIKSGIGLNNTAQEVVSALRVAQNKAISSQRPSVNAADLIGYNYGVHFVQNENKYTLFYGDNFDPSATSNEEHQLLGDTKVCATTDARFHRLEGVPVQADGTTPIVAAASITVGIDCGGSTTKTIKVEPSGTIQLL
ncbi:MAG: hypothetical protein V1907_00935 [Candidatus Kerfeldbacteria bacterium]